MIYSIYGCLCSLITHPLHTHIYILAHTHTYPLPTHQWIDRLRGQSGKLSLLRHTAYLNFVCLRCGEVNQLLATRASDLADRLVTFLVDRNRDINKE